MNGAESLIHTLVNGGVDVCFMNPGTSEMHFVAALDSVPQMRGVLCLFEGVATGAADGYGRMAGVPAATLLHLGPGLGNGIANLHNAHKAHTPLVNIVGEHATWHIQHNAPLTADIAALARTVSAWVRTASSAATVGADGAAAIAAARTGAGQVATLILPGDAAWEEGGVVVEIPPLPRPIPVAPERVTQAAALLHSGRKTALVLGETVMDEASQRMASRIAAATGSQLIGARSGRRVVRGAGLPVLERIPYPVDQALAMLAGFEQMILVGAYPPVAFFAYPGKPSLLAPPDCRMYELADLHSDCLASLAALADELDAPDRLHAVNELARPALPSGPISVEKVWAGLAALLPAGAILSDESVTSGRNAHRWMAGAPPHEWLHITGGSIGQGLPVATGAALACPERRVFAMESDGS
ncbi:MAG: acetolactate synthase large subunit, partial [Chloroflexi bacterium]